MTSFLEKLGIVIVLRVVPYFGESLLAGIKPKVGAIFGEHCHENFGAFWKSRRFRQFDLPVVDNCLECDDHEKRAPGRCRRICERAILAS